MDPSSHRLHGLPLATRCRLAFLEGAIEAWREANDCEPPPEVLARVLARYPGEPAEARPLGEGSVELAVLPPIRRE